MGVGKWLSINGDGIYGTRAWKNESEGQFRFTTKAENLYAIAIKWSEEPVVIQLLPESSGKVKKISLLGSKENIAFSQDATGLKITFPKEKPCDFAYTFKIEGITL